MYFECSLVRLFQVLRAKIDGLFKHDIVGQIG